MLDNLNENKHLITLTNLAAANTSTADYNSDSCDYGEDDDDDPRNCVMFAKGTCKYKDKNFVIPKETSWIGCEFPDCNDWYHARIMPRYPVTHIE